MSPLAPQRKSARKQRKRGSGRVPADRNRTLTKPHVSGFQGQSQRGGPLASKGHTRKLMSPPTDSFLSESGPPKNNLFWRNRAFFPVASRSSARCSKAQIASYSAQIRRFLAPTAWASSTSTTKKISPQATQAWFRMGSASVKGTLLPLGWQDAWCFGKKKVWVKWFQVPQARTKSRPPDVKILRFDLGKETSPNIATPRACPWFVFSQSTSFRG